MGPEHEEPYVRLNRLVQPGCQAIARHVCLWIGGHRAPGARIAPGDYRRTWQPDVLLSLREWQVDQTPVQTGLAADGWVEVLKIKRAGAWVDFAGNEEVIDADLSELVDGGEVKVASK